VNDDAIDRLSETKRALLQQRLRGEGSPREGVVRLERRQRDGPAPLAVAQEQLWYFSQLVPGNPVYNEAVTIRKDGPFDVNAFRSAFREIVRRHEIWRSTFEVVDGEPVQIVHQLPALELPLIDLSLMARADAEREAGRMAAADAMRPYSLDREPLIRPLLVRIGSDHHRLYLALHHLVFDGVSLYRIVLPELIALYQDFAEGRAPSLPEQEIQYSDYAVWTHERAGMADFTRRINYWRQHLAGVAPMQLPNDHPRPARPTFRGSMLSLRIPTDLAAGLRLLSRQAGGTLFQTLAAAFAVLLQSYSDHDDVVFGSVADLRERSELETMVGYCLTPLVLRADLSDDPPFLELLERIRTDLLSALENLVPFDRLVRELNPRRDLASNPLFQAAIVLEPPVVSPDPSWSMHQMETDIGDAVGNAKFDLHLELDERPEGHIDGRLIYSSDLFERDTVRRITGHWLRLLEGVVEHPQQPISTLPLLTERELQQQLVEWNATRSEYPRNACVHQLVERQAECTPDAIAVVSGDDRLTYRELDVRANQLAQRLRVAGAGSGAVVAICVERSPDMVAGLLGILKTGAAYVPLDPRHPRDRLRFMLEDSAATVLLTQRHLVDTLPEHGAVTLCLESDSAQSDAQANTTPTSATSPEDLAYILYTSGSTGRPKGVQVRHRNVVNLMTALNARPGLDPDDVALAVATFSFDMSVGDIFAPLGVGARVVLAARDDARDPRRLGALIDASGATLMHATPTTWQMLLESGWAGSPRLVAVCGGDTLSEALAGSLLDRCAAVWNGYGPTEAAVYTTFSQVARGAPITIGRPIANVRVYILDRWRRPVAVGIPGEIVIGGAGVSAGYANQPDETAQRFVPDPFDPGSSVYRTGDLARFLADGNIQHMGRLDRQVKVRGVRIEPGEIEAALLDHPAVSSAIVVAHGGESSNRRIVAYVLAEGVAPEAAELRALLRRTLPAHMVPSAFVFLTALPITTSGKIDHTALPPPAEGASTAGVSSAAPRTAAEAHLSRIWARALGVTRVGVEDDFFDLGGHSLLAVRLLIDVQRELGVELPLESIFKEGATVAGMAALIEHPRRKLGDSRLIVPIQPSGSAPALFFLHPNEQSLLIMRHFTGVLGADQPVLSLLPEGGGRRFQPSRGFEDLASQMLDSIREIQEHGPYYLAGLCLGGNVAYEIAGRLQAAGEAVAYLGLLDAGSPVAAADYLQWVLSLRGRATRIARALKEGPRATLSKADEAARRVLPTFLASARLRPTPPPTIFDWIGALKAISEWVYHPHTVPVDLYVSDEMAKTTGSRSLGWDKLHRGALAVHAIPGEHLSMVKEPHVRVLAKSLATSLRSAQLLGTDRLSVDATQHAARLGAP
jgi:amino acid adenylation domain-containing protein